MITNEELVSRAKGGCKQSYEELFCRNDGFNKHMANKYHNVAEYDELLSTARYGMVKAYKAFDPSRGYKFITFAGIVIGNEIKMLDRRLKRSVATVSLDHPLGMDQEGNVLLIRDVVRHDRCGDASSRLCRIDTANEILDLLSILTQNEYIVITGQYFDGMTQLEIANKYGMHQATISRTKRRALKRLQREWERRERRYR